MDNVEVYAIMFVGECIYVGRSSDGANNAILRHFQHASENKESYRKFNPKLYDFIVKNNDINKYSYNSFGFYSNKDSIKEQKKLIEINKTYEKCNSFVKKITTENRIKSPKDKGKRLTKPDNRCRRIKCDQTGKYFISMVKCADKYGVSYLDIFRSIKYKNRNRKNVPEQIKGLSFSYY